MNKIEILAPAKINLFLEVDNRRPDGYHNISTIFQTVSLYDKITLKQKKKGFDLKCSNPDIPCDERNLALKAANLLKNCLNFEQGAEISIKKEIPVGAGLGGGSSDAAAVLLGLLKVWKKSLPIEKLCDLASNIGADVPFFLYKGTAAAKGIGDELTKLSGVRPPKWYILIYPRFGVPTKEVYRRLSFPLTNHQKINRITGQLKGGSLHHWSLFNRLEEAVLPYYPEILNIKNLLKSMKIDCMMSGSGSTVFGIVSSQQEGKKILAELKKHPWDVWLVKSV